MKGFHSINGSFRIRKSTTKKTITKSEIKKEEGVMRRHWKELIVYLCAAILLVIRVDLWWWGKKIYPILLGWITIPMIYQFCIWFIGFLLVIYLCNAVWGKDTDEA